MERVDGACGNARPHYSKVNADLRTGLADPKIQKRFQVLGTYTRDLTPEQTGEFMRSEEQLWWPIVRQVEAEDQKPSR